MQQMPGNEAANPEVVASPNIEQQPEQQPRVEVPREQGIQQENFSVAPAQVPAQQVQPVQTQTTAPVVNDDEVAEEFVKSPGSEDKPWVKKADDVMKQFSEAPYDEEEAEEALHQEYMDKRFGVKISKGEHSQK